MCMVLDVIEVGLCDVLEVELVVQVMSVYNLLLYKVVDQLRYGPTR